MTEAHNSQPFTHPMKLPVDWFKPTNFNQQSLLHDLLHVDRTTTELKMLDILHGNFMFYFLIGPLFRLVHKRLVRSELFHKKSNVLCPKEPAYDKQFDLN